MKLAILASGKGSTAQVLFDKAAVVVTNNPTAGVIASAQGYGLPVEIVTRQESRAIDEFGVRDLKKSQLFFGNAIIWAIEKYPVDFVSQNGWSVMTPTNVVERFKDKIVNSHPAPLDPGFADFGGFGMHGTAVHEAVLYFARHIKRPFTSEVCLHKVESEYDKGDLLAYSEVAILPDDTAETLQERVKEIEKKLLVDFWNKVEKEGKLQVVKRPSRLILSEEEKTVLAEAKKWAIDKSSKDVVIENS